MISIVQADSDVLVKQATTLASEYVAWIIDAIHDNYPHLETTEFIAAHDYDEPSAKFPGEHVPPHGRLLVALRDGQAGGCIALARLDEAVCEMRTLFVRPAFRGAGMGKQLVDAILREARDIGYDTMRLDTLAFMESALTLYRSLGFRDTQPYRQVPGDLNPYIRFLELDL